MAESRSLVGSALLITDEDVRAIVTDAGIDRFMDELIEGIEAAAADYDPVSTRTLPRAGFTYEKPSLGLLEWMPAMELGEVVSVKLVGYHPTNPHQRAIPSVLSTTTLFDTTTGSLLAVVDSTLLTAMRTGAASALATDALAHPESTVFGAIGCGAQAVTQIHAISRIRPIERIVAFDAEVSTAQSLGRRLPPSAAVPIAIAPTPETVLAECDVASTATTVDIGAGPVVRLVDRTKPHLHINAVGSDFPGKTELPVELLRAALVVPDEPDQCLAEGECQQLERSDVGPSLADVLGRREDFEIHRDQLTVFDSTGWALEDLVAARITNRHAHRLGLGTAVSALDHGDPYSPYGVLLD